MIEVTGNLWTYPAQIKCITTNGFVKLNGEAVMGRGCAQEAARRFPWLPRQFGQDILDRGLSAHCIAMNPAQEGWDLWSFPVKYNWWEKASLPLIAQSAKQLARLWTEWRNPNTGQLATVVLPRPGCGNGQLSWDEVKKVIEPILTGDNFHVIDFPTEVVDL